MIPVRGAFLPKGYDPETRRPAFLSAASTTAIGVVGAVFGSATLALAKFTGAVVPDAVTSVATNLYLRYCTWRAREHYGRAAALKVAWDHLTVADTFLYLSLVTTLLKTYRSVKSTMTTPTEVATVGGGAQPYAHPVGYSVAWNYVPTLASAIALRFPVLGPVQIPLIGWQSPVVRPRRWGAYVLTLQLAHFVGSVLLTRYKSPIGAAITTRLIHNTLTTGALGSSALRQIFVDTPVVRSKPQTNHTHGVSASTRNAGSATAALLAEMMALKPYYVQQSLADVRKGKDGDRSFHWPKDIAVPPREFHFDPTSQACVLVDVDEWIDVPALLAKCPGTYFISTFQPTAAACSTGEYTFRFQQDGRVLYRVSGGAEYEHHIWDYSGDTFLVERADLLWKTVVAYHIDRKYLDAHHSLIMLSVIGKFEMPSLLPTSWFLEGKTLKRMNPVNSDHVVLDIINSDGAQRSVALLGDYTAVTLPRDKFDAVRAVAVVAKTTVSPHTVASNIAPASAVGLPTERLPPGHAAILASYLRSVIPLSPPVVYPPSSALLPIYFAKHDYDAPVPLAAFGSPLIGPCYAYASSIASDDRCIAGRVEAFQKNNFEGDIPPTLAEYMVEFAQFLVPEPFIGQPQDSDYVYEKQDRPNQQSRLREAEITGDARDAKWSAFVKKETATAPSDPRNISMGVAADNLDYSVYVYSFHDGVMCKQPWYAFSKTPKQIAGRVCDILAAATHAVLADGHRYDGHVSRRARILERLCFLRYFARSYHARLNESMDKQFGIPGTTTEGRKYFSGYSRGSGSAETSDCNSMLSAFIDYCAHRNTLVNGKKKSPQQAWDALGEYGGDDSVSANVDPAALRRSAELMGQDYDIAVVPRGEIGVEFLNRRFGFDVWTGDPSSMANPHRLLAKLWVGPRTLPQPLKRFAERASGYYRMDRNSPVIGEIVTLAHELLGDFVDGELMPWDGKHSVESNWPNDDSGWMTDVFNTSIPDFDWDRFRTWIRSVRASGDPQLLLAAPLCTPAPPTPTVKQTCVVGEDLLDPQFKDVPKDDKGKEEASDFPQKDEPMFDDLPTPPSTATEDAGFWDRCHEMFRGWDTVDDLIDQPQFVFSPNTPPKPVPMAQEDIERSRAESRRGSIERATAARAAATVSMVEDVVPTLDEKGRHPRRKTAPKDVDKSNPKKAVDPRNWRTPAQKPNETPEAFAVRLKAWGVKRQSVAARLGVKL